MRPADARDVPLLRAMLYEAFAWRGDPRFPLLEDAAVRLYERLGFVRVGYVGTSWTMQRILG